LITFAKIFKLTGVIALGNRYRNSLRMIIDTGVRSPTMGRWRGMVWFTMGLHFECFLSLL